MLVSKRFIRFDGNEIAAKLLLIAHDHTMNVLPWRNAIPTARTGLWVNLQNSLPMILTDVGKNRSHCPCSNWIFLAQPPRGSTPDSFSRRPTGSIQRFHLCITPAVLIWDWESKFYELPPHANTAARMAWLVPTNLANHHALNHYTFFRVNHGFHIDVFGN